MEPAYHCRFCYEQQPECAHEQPAGKNAELIFKQSKLSQYPNASFSTSFSANSGSNQNPVTFSRITETYLSSGMQLQSSADIFNFYSKRNTIAANQWEVQAAQAQTDKLKNDIALSAANAYLQILLANEQLQLPGYSCSNRNRNLQLYASR